MTIDEAQAEVRRAFVGGGPGVLVSALVWLATAIAEGARGESVGFAVLFVGGMLIFPFSIVLARHVFGRQPLSARNSLGATALESTVAIIGGLFAAWLFLPLAPRLAIPLAAVAVGTHYAVFRTVYGDRRFWALAALVTGVGVVATVRPLLPGTAPLLVAAIEGAAGVWLTRGGMRG